MSALADRCPTCVRHAGLGFPHPCAKESHEPASACRHCPWPGCVCTHSSGCDRGWLTAEPLADGYEPAVARCPNCAVAAKDAALLISVAS
jgi:hypothetical protein